MPMLNPPHPGLAVREDCLEPLGLNVTEGAKVLGLDATYYRAYWFLGLAHDRLGNFEAAIDALEIAKARGGGEIAFGGRILGALGHCIRPEAQALSGTGGRQVPVE